MQPMQQKPNYSIECVWTLSAKGLRCHWVERPAPALTCKGAYETVPQMQLRVA